MLFLQVVKDMHLFALVLGILLIDSGILLAWTLVDPIQFRSILLPRSVSSFRDSDTV